MTEVRSDGRTGITEPGLDEGRPGGGREPCRPLGRNARVASGSSPSGESPGTELSPRGPDATQHPTPTDRWSNKPETGGIAWGGSVSPARRSAACVIISLLNLAGVLEEITPLEVKKHLKFNHFFSFSY